MNLLASQTNLILSAIPSKTPQARRDIIAASPIRIAYSTVSLRRCQLTEIGRPRFRSRSHRPQRILFGHDQHPSRLCLSAATCQQTRANHEPSRPQRRTAPHDDSWSVSLVTEATNAQSQATGLDLPGSQISQQQKSRPSSTKSDQRHHCSPGAQSWKKCLLPHSRPRLISQQQLDRIRQCQQVHRPGNTNLDHHNREEIHTTINPLQTRRHRHNSGHQGGQAAMAHLRIHNNRHNIILPRVHHRPLLR